MPAVTDPLAPLLDLPGVADGGRIGPGRRSTPCWPTGPCARRSADVSAESSLRGRLGLGLAGRLARSPWPTCGRAPHALADPVLQGALRAQAAIGPLADTWRGAPRQALARLHALAAADLVADRDELGRPAGRGARRLDTLAAVLAATSAPAVVVAAIVHGELLSLDAFAPASGCRGPGRGPAVPDRPGPGPEVAGRARGRSP